MSNLELDKNPSLKFFTPSENKETIYIGQNKFIILPSDRAAEILLREDIREEEVLNLTQQILLSLGGISHKILPCFDNFSIIDEKIPSLTSSSSSNQPPENDTTVYSPIIFTTSTSNSSQGIPYDTIWTRIEICLGVNLSFERVLFIKIQGVPPKLFASNNPIQLLEQFFIQFCSNLSHAMKIENFSIPPYIPSASSDSTSYESIAQKYGFNYCVERTPISSGKLAEGIIDINYIRDLQSSIAQLMNNQITQDCEILDNLINNFQLKCARLMTLIKPTYQLASLNQPNPPTFAPLSNYPLELSKESIRIQSINTCKLLILRAKKSYREFIQKKNDTATEKECLLFKNHDFLVQFLLLNIKNQLFQWSKEEYLIRIQRKLLSIKDRLYALQLYRIELILLLTNRFHNISSSPSSSTSSSAFSSTFSSWFSSETPDLKHHQFLLSLFPFLTYNEPILIETKGIIKDKTGSIYLTQKNLLYHSSINILSNPVIYVLPFNTIERIEGLTTIPVSSTTGINLPIVNTSQGVFYCIKTISSSFFASTTNLISFSHFDRFNISKFQNFVLNVTKFDSKIDLIRIIDKSGQEFLLKFIDTTPEFTPRFFDILELIFLESMYTSGSTVNDFKVTEKVIDEISLSSGSTPKETPVISQQTKPEEFAQPSSEETKINQIETEQPQKDEENENLLQNFEENKISTNEIEINENQNEIENENEIEKEKLKELEMDKETIQVNTKEKEKNNEDNEDSEEFLLFQSLINSCDDPIKPSNIIEVCSNNNNSEDEILTNFQESSNPPTSSNVSTTISSVPPPRSDSPFSSALLELDLLDLSTPSKPNITNNNNTSFEDFEKELMLSMLTPEKPSVELPTPVISSSSDNSIPNTPPPQKNTVEENKGKKNLVSNIQKFLQKSQSKA